MTYSFSYRIRDIFLCIVLIFLGKIALNHHISFLIEHKKSIIHELDRSFIDQLYTAQRQTRLCSELNTMNDALSEVIHKIQNKLAEIEKKYKKNSPGVMLLGPLGTASIIIKEKELNQQLIDAINDLTKTLYCMHTSQETFKTASSINEGLMKNKVLLNILRHQ